MSGLIVLYITRHVDTQTYRRRVVLKCELSKNLGLGFRKKNLQTHPELISLAVSDMGSKVDLGMKKVFHNFKFTLLFLSYSIFLTLT